MKKDPSKFHIFPAMRLASEVPTTMPPTQRFIIFSRSVEDKLEEEPHTVNGDEDEVRMNTKKKSRIVRLVPLQLEVYSCNKVLLIELRFRQSFACGKLSHARSEVHVL